MFHNGGFMYTFYCIRPGTSCFKKRIFRRSVNTLSEMARVCANPNIEVIDFHGLTVEEYSILMHKLNAIMRKGNNNEFRSNKV